MNLIVQGGKFTETQCAADVIFYKSFQTVRVCEFRIFKKSALFGALGVNLVILFDERVRYVKKVKNHWPRY